MQRTNCASSGGPVLDKDGDARPRRGDDAAVGAMALGVFVRLATLLAAALVPVTLVGCSDPCAAAADKLSSCGAAAGDGGSNVSTQTCDSWYLCQSNCINNATCTEILYPGGNDPLTKCQADCLGR